MCFVLVQLFTKVYEYLNNYNTIQICTEKTFKEINPDYFNAF